MTRQSRTPPARRSYPRTYWRQTVAAFILSGLAGCFHSDGLLFLQCQQAQNNCRPGSGELPSAITPRACFTSSVSDDRGYCVPYCKNDSACEDAATPYDAACFSVDERSGSADVALRLCLLVCDDDAACPPAMVCRPYTDADGTTADICIPGDEA